MNQTSPCFIFFKIDEIFFKYILAEKMCHISLLIILLCVSEYIRNKNYGKAKKSCHNHTFKKIWFSSVLIHLSGICSKFDSLSSRTRFFTGSIRGKWEKPIWRERKNFFAWLESAYGRWRYVCSSSQGFCRRAKKSMFKLLIKINFASKKTFAVAMDTFELSKTWFMYMNKFYGSTSITSWFTWSSHKSYL